MSDKDVVIGIDLGTTTSCVSVWVATSNKKLYISL